MKLTRFKSLGTVFFHFGLAFVGVMSSVLIVSVNSSKPISAQQLLYESGSIQKTYSYDSYTIETDSTWNSLSIIIQNMDNGQNFHLFANYGSSPIESGGLFEDYSYSSTSDFENSHQIYLGSEDIQDDTLYVVVYAVEGSGSYDYVVEVDDVEVTNDYYNLQAAENYARYTIETDFSWRSLSLNLEVSSGSSYLYAQYGSDPTMNGGSPNDFYYSSQYSYSNQEIIIPSGELETGTLYILVALDEWGDDESSFTLTANSSTIGELQRNDVVNGTFEYAEYMYYRFNVADPIDFLNVKLIGTYDYYHCIYLTKTTEFSDDVYYYDNQSCDTTEVELGYSKYDEAEDLTGDWYIAISTDWAESPFTLELKTGSYSDAPATELLSEEGSVDYYGNSSQNHYFTTQDYYESLYVVVRSKDPGQSQFTISVSDPDNNYYYGASFSDSHSVVKLQNTGIGEFYVDVAADDGETEYFVDVFTQDYLESGNAELPVISHAYENYFSNGSAMGNFNVDFNASDDLIVASIAYESTNVDSHYVGNIQNGLYGDFFTEVCSVKRGNSFMGIYSFPLDTGDEDGFITFRPAGIQGTPTNITNINIAAYTINGGDGFNLPIGSYTCNSGNSSSASFDLNSKDNELLIGSYFNGIGSYASGTGTQEYASYSAFNYMFGAYSNTGDAQNITFTSTSVDWVGGMIAIRAEGPIFSPLSDSGDTQAPVFQFTTQPGAEASSTVWFEGTVTDDIEVSSLNYTLDGGSANFVTLYGEDPTSKTFMFSVEYIGLGSHTIVLRAQDNSGNIKSEVFEFEVAADEENPVLLVTTYPDSITGTSVLFEGTITDNISVYDAYYDVNGIYSAGIDLWGSATNKSFSFEIQDLTETNNIVTIVATDTAGNEDSQVFNFTSDVGKPFCDLTHQNVVVNTNTATYSNIVCTDNVGVTGVDIRVYHAIYGDLYLRAPLPESVTSDGTFGDPEEVITFTTPVTLPDGGIQIQLWPADAVGNDPLHISDDTFIVEAEDNTPPTLNLAAVRPDPTVDNTPSIAGSCADASLYDTNTYITEMSYRLDGGSWELITPVDGAYNNEASERFSVELPELSLGEHTVDVICYDAEGLSQQKSDTFTVIEPVSVEPEIVIYSEGFDDHENHSLAETDLIWGNGKLRLREDITTTRTLKFNDGYPGRYGGLTGHYPVAKDPVDSNRIWFVRGASLFLHNVAADTVTEIEPSDYGLPDFSTAGIFFLEVTNLNGNTYIWVSDLYNLYVINYTGGQGIRKTYSGVNGIIQAIAPDTQRGRLAAYVKFEGVESGNTQIAYVDLNGTLTNPADDVMQRIPTSVGVNQEDTVLGLLLDAPTNNLYINTYGYGIYKYNDNNTPLSFGDDQVGFYENDFGGGNVFSMLIDPNGNFVFGTAGNQTGRLFVVTDTNGTPFDTSDDTIVNLVTPQMTNYLNIYGLSYLEGLNDVGDQIIMRGENGDAFYLNFNDTYEDLLDDTVLRLDTLGNIRGSADIVVTDYNTLYANINRAGLYKVDLNRGWAESGQAVIYSTPEDRMVTNFFELIDVNEANNISLIAGAPQEPSFLDRIASLIFPKVKADGETITYSVSIDDGVTWSPITLAEIVNFDQTDYRVKFRVEMAEIDNSSPVLNGYTLAFGAYQDEEAAEVYTMNLSVVPSTVNTSSNFTLTVKVIDSLGFTNPNYNGSISLSLLDSVSSANRSDLLSINSINLVNGEGVLNNVSISDIGTFVITGVFESNSYFTDTITVLYNAPDPVPEMSFTASKYTMNLGETIALTWDTENLSSLSINRGIGELNTLDGSINVSPTTTTVYTLSGTGDYGNLESSVTIVVIQPAGETPDPVITPTDSDNDGLTDEEEIELGTDPNNPDSDNDGLLDGEEVDGCVYILATTDCSETVFEPTDPLNPNTDGDSLLDGEEVMGCFFQIGTTVCSESVFEPTDPNDPSSPESLPVVLETSSGELSDGNEVQEETTEPNIIERIVTSVVDTISTTSQSGALPVALVTTTTAATALTAVTYPNFIGYAFLWFRSKKKKLEWGLVYDYTNNKPVPFVTVRLLDNNNNFVSEEISDLNGKYSIVALPGEYILEAKVNSYEIYNTKIQLVTESVNLEIPLTPINPEYDRKVMVRNWLKTNLPKINAIVFFVGLIFSVLTLIFAPKLINLVILIIFIIQLVVYYWVGKDKTGKVFDAVTNEELRGVFVRIFESESGRQLGSVSTDKSGKYNLFIKPGKYIIKVENSQYQLATRSAQGKDALGTSYMIINQEKEGLLNMEIPMERKANAGNVSEQKFGFMGQ